MNENGLQLMLLAVFAPLVTGVITMFLPRRAVTGRVLVALAGPVLACVALLVRGVSDQVATVAFAPSLNLDLAFRADALGQFFALLVAGMGVLIVLYARGYFGRDENSLYRFYPTLGLFATAMLGIVLSDNMLSMFLFWEMTSVSSFLLIGWDRDNPKAVRLALQAFVTTGAGGMALLAGVITLGVATGAWSFSALPEALGGGLSEQNRTLVTAAFFLMFAGGAAKSAQWPLHFWLPGAMAAPTPVSAYLHSATMVKAGVYLFARLFPTMSAQAAWTAMLVSFGAVTMLLGGYLALRSLELKKIFAYTTVSQLGLLVCAYGLGGYTYHGESNIIWPVTQILNHALYKAPLFIIAGAIMHVVGRKMLPDLRGLWHTHRTLALIALAGAYAMGGLPLTLSFNAKEAFLYQVYHAAEHHPVIWAVGAMAVLTAACNVAIFVRMAATFCSRVRETAHVEGHDHHAHEGGFWGACIWWPAALIVSLQFVLGIVPGVFEPLLRLVETHALYWSDHFPGPFYALKHAGAPPFLMSVAAIGLGVGVGLSPLLRRPSRDVHDLIYPAYETSTQQLGVPAV